jgi:hypothetical protein
MCKNNHLEQSIVSFLSTTFIPFFLQQGRITFDLCGRRGMRAKERTISTSVWSVSGSRVEAGPAMRPAHMPTIPGSLLVSHCYTPHPQLYIYSRVRYSVSWNQFFLLI